jgi:hypothetical protein
VFSSADAARADSRIAYLARLGVGQARLLLSREPITAELIATLDPVEQRALERLRAALAFGAGTRRRRLPRSGQRRWRGWSSSRPAGNRIRR